MNKKELNKILKLHKKWLNSEDDGERADLRWADLRGADLSWADLSWANLREADLSRANLSGATLREADLSRANLREADFSSANLREADLSEANLSEANLSWAKLREANLRGAYLIGADLRGADLRGADLPDFQIIPEEGSFICYKKVKDANEHKFILTLEIPETAKRTSSLVGRKCRVNEAKVIKIEDMNGNEITDNTLEFTGTHYDGIIYRLGSTVVEPEYDDDIRVECTKGVHVFETKKEAKEWS